MTDDRKHLVAGTLLIAVLVPLAAGLALRHRSGREASTARLSPVPRSAIPSLSASSPAAVGQDLTSAPAADDRHEKEICGHGGVALDASDPFAASRYLAESTRHTAQRWLSALKDSGDIRVRAAGLFLEGKLATAALTVQPMVEQTRDELVQLAVGGGDPVVYAIGVYACNANRVPAGGSCGQISLNAWATLDADNAVPWLALAAQARERNDPAAESAAFGHAAGAHRFDSYADSLLALAIPELAQDASALERWYFAMQVLGVEAAFAPPYGILSEHCTDEAMQDSEVRGECAALAELMVGKTSTLVESALGTHLGARAGWPKQQVDTLQRDWNMLMQAIAQTEPADDREQWSCSSTDRGNAYIRQRIELGELGAARAALVAAQRP